ncbi:MAG: hypothetical protein C4525_02560 [Desulfarculus sp.]|nr:MAG: hypothetical protein C4525_02560 [Desulfarculus sp.]
MDDSDLKTGPLIINEAQFLLAQKRTHLAAVRTGLAMLALPMSIITFLVATSRFYHFQNNLGYLIPLLALCAGLLGMGVHMVLRSLIRLHRTESALFRLRQQSSLLNSLEQEAAGHKTTASFF